MSGVKGRSGKTSTIAQRRKRIAASKAGGEARSKATRKQISTRPTTEVTWDEHFKGPFNCIADYDKRLGPICSWADVERREKAIAQILNNESLTLANEVSRGNLLTRKQVEARDDAWNTAAADLADAAQRMLDTVPRVTSEQRAAYLIAFKAWRSELNAGLSKVRTP